jgi:hypothetical protein
LQASGRQSIIPARIPYAHLHIFRLYAPGIRHTIKILNYALLKQNHINNISTDEISANPDLDVRISLSTDLEFSRYAKQKSEPLAVIKTVGRDAGFSWIYGKHFESGFSTKKAENPSRDTTIY